MPQGDFLTANKYADGERIKGNPLVNRIYDEFIRAVDFHAPDRERNRDNWKLYWGIDGSQYPDKVKKDLQAEDRDLDTFNIATQKVDSLTGAILKNPFEMDFIPVDGDVSPLTNAIKKLQLSDKEMMDWDLAKEDLVCNGLIYESDIEMFISEKYHDLGNIAFRTILPGHLIKDPNWLSGNMRDCLKAWRVSYLTPRQIKSVYPDIQSFWLDARVGMSNIYGTQFGSTKDVTPNFYLEQNDGADRVQVIEEYEMIDEEVEVEYDKMTGLEIPETDDLTVKIRFLDSTNPYWTPENLGKRKKTKKFCYVTAICPDMGFDTILEYGRTEIQVGRLPFFSWSASRKNGKCRGIIDLIKDCQRTINYRESLITFMIQTQAHSPELIDPQLFNDDIKSNDYKAHKNNPSRVFETAAGALARGLAPVKVFAGGVDPNVTQQLLRMWDIADRISKAPAVSDARSEGQGESGYLFAQKQALAEQQQLVLFTGLRRVENEMGEAYIEQAKIQYSLGGVRRLFKVNGGKDQIVLNNKLPKEGGGSTIENDISMLPRHKVVVSDSPQGTTQRLTSRALSVEMLKNMPQEKIGTRNILASTMVKTVDNLSEEDKNNLKVMEALETTLIVEQLKMNIMTAKSQRLQAEMQVAQIEAQKNAAQSQQIPPAENVPGAATSAAPGQPVPPEEAQASAEQPQEQVPIPA